MTRILSYNLFEEETAQKEDIVDRVIRAFPNLINDSFTQSIIPAIKVAIHASTDVETREAYENIKTLAIKKFGGYDYKISQQEILERFVNHYIDFGRGILRMRDLKRFIRHVKPQVKRSKKLDRSFRISPDVLDSFTDGLIEILKKDAIKYEDIKNVLKKIYEWSIPALSIVYHLDSLKNLKYMEEGVLFNSDELATLFGFHEAEPSPDGDNKSVSNEKDFKKV